MKKQKHGEVKELGCDQTAGERQSGPHPGWNQSLWLTQATCRLRLEKPSWTVSIPTRIHEGQPKLGSQIIWKVGAGWGLIRWGDFSSTGKRSPGCGGGSFPGNLGWKSHDLPRLPHWKMGTKFHPASQEVPGRESMLHHLWKVFARVGKAGEKKKKMQNFSQETLPGVFDGCLN